MDTVFHKAHRQGEGRVSLVTRKTDGEGLENKLPRPELAGSRQRHRQKTAEDVHEHGSTPVTRPSAKHRTSKQGKQTHAQLKKTIEKDMRRSTRGLFPRMHKETYVVPPIRFNVSRQYPCEDLPGCFVPGDTPYSSTRADESVERVLTCLQQVLSGRNVFLLSGIIFDEYLNKRISVNSKQPKQQMPVPFPRSMDLFPAYRRGEIELMIIDKVHGIMIVDIKAVGDTLEEMNVDESEASELVSKVVDKALLLMGKERDVVHHLVSDIPATIPISVVLALPNLTKDTLVKTLQAKPDLREALERCLMTKDPVEDLCLCADLLPKKHHTPTDGDIKCLAEWWDRHYPCRPAIIEDRDFERIVARFCGHMSTVSVWTPQPPRREVRTLGQAVHEAGERFSTMILLPQQLNVLHCDDRRVYLVGPPGSGKTVLLTLKAVQWVRAGYHVCVLTAKDGPSPIALIIVKQIKKTLEQFKVKEQQQGTIEADSILKHTDGLRTDGSTLVTRLKSHAQGRPICLIIDDIQGEAVRSILSVSHQLPECHLWTAGAWPTICPSGFLCKMLSTSVRCPPCVQTVLHMTEPLKPWQRQTEGESRRQYRYVTASTGVRGYPLPTTGVPVRLLSHAPHGSHPILQCRECALALVSHLKELRIGEDIQYKDVLILTADTQSLHLGLRTSLFHHTLLKQGLHVQVIEEMAGSQHTLAFPPNKITLTSYQFVTGLERKVVVFLPANTASDNPHVQSCMDEVIVSDLLDVEPCLDQARPSCMDEVIVSDLADVEPCVDQTRPPCSDKVVVSDQADVEVRTDQVKPSSDISKAESCKDQVIPPSDVSRAESSKVQEEPPSDVSREEPRKSHVRPPFDIRTQLDASDDDRSPRSFPNDWNRQDWTGSSDSDSDYSSGFDFASVCNLSSDEDDCPFTSVPLKPRTDDRSPNEGNTTRNGNDTTRNDEVTVRNDDKTTQNNENTTQNDDVIVQNDDTTQNDDIIPYEDQGLANPADDDRARNADRTAQHIPQVRGHAAQPTDSPAEDQGSSHRVGLCEADSSQDNGVFAATSTEGLSSSTQPSHRVGQCKADSSQDSGVSTDTSTENLSSNTQLMHSSQCQLGRAVHSLHDTNREILWYSASRCLSQLIIFHF